MKRKKMHFYFSSWELILNGALLFCIGPRIKSEVFSLKSVSSLTAQLRLNVRHRILTQMNSDCRTWPFQLWKGHSFTKNHLILNNIEKKYPPFEMFAFSRLSQTHRNQGLTQFCSSEQYQSHQNVNIDELSVSQSSFKCLAKCIDCEGKHFCLWWQIRDSVICK